MTVVAMTSTWSTSVTYLCLTLIKLIAVWKPLHFNRLVSTRKCSYLLISTWTLSLLLTSIVGCLIIFSSYPDLRHSTGCSYTTCLRDGVIFNYCFRIACFVIVMATYAFVCYFVYRKFKETRSLQKSKTKYDQQLSLRKLAVHIGNYGFFYSATLLEGFIVLVKYPGCSMFLHIYDILVISGWVYLALTMRAIADPIIDILVDERLRKLISFKAPCKR